MRPTASPPIDERRGERRSVLPHWAARRFGERDPTLLGWALATGVAAITFMIARETAYRQLTIGILLTTGTLFVLLSLFDIVWGALGRTFVSQDGR